MNDSALTTIDNPYDPFTEWDSWLKFDEEHDYDTCGLLARFAKTSMGLSDNDNEALIDEAMQKILTIFPSLYKIVHPQPAEQAD